MVKIRFTHERIGELLIKWQTITHKQLNRALKIQRYKCKKRIGEILIRLSFAKEEDIVRALIVQYHIPYLPINNYDINPEAINIIPEEICHKLLLIPIDKTGNILTVAMSNPLNMQAIVEIETLSHCNVQAFITTSSDIRDNIEKYYKKRAFPSHLWYA